MTQTRDHVPREAVDLSIECHSCGHQAGGYTLGELMVDHGWRAHSTGVGQRLFVMCGTCTETYEQRRAA
jgi:hypothetical protein